MQLKGAMKERFPYTSMYNAVVIMYRTEGIAAFYKGMLPNLLKVAPSMGVAFVTYEFTKARLFGVPMKLR
jgi:solute carrier family 25 phosphate transporter 23/24/25/41